MNGLVLHGCKGIEMKAISPAFMITKIEESYVIIPTILSSCKYKVSDSVMMHGSMFISLSLSFRSKKLI